MARPQKIGLDYFPLDVDIFEDDKIIPVLIENENAENIIIRLMCSLYRNGYYIEYNKNLVTNVAYRSRVPIENVEGVIKSLIESGFFNKNIFTEHSILTSSGIQKRWKLATRKRVVSYELEYWLLPQCSNNTAEETELMAEETELITPESTQKKLKEIKLNKIREESNIICPTPIIENQEEEEYNKGQVDKQPKREEEENPEENTSRVINDFIPYFEKNFSCNLSPDNITSIKRGVMNNLKQIEIEYHTVRIFLTTIVKRMLDISSDKTINEPVGFFLSGCFGKNKYLWQLTRQEEESGSGYHKNMIRKKESRKNTSSIGLKSI